MKAKIQMWGNSLALRLPKLLASSKDLHNNDEVELVPDENGIKIVKARPTKTLEGLIEASPPETLIIDDEDREWVNVEPRGRELI